MLHLILGRAGSGKTFYIRNKIGENAALNKNGQILIVPEQFSFESERALLKIGNNAAAKTEVLSFTRLCARIFKLYGCIAGTRIDDSGRAVMMGLALSQVSHELGIYKKTAQHPEFIRSALNAVSEFKNCAVKPENILSALAGLPDNAFKNRMREIAVIYAAYNAQVSQSYIDPQDDLMRLNETLMEQDFFCGKSVYFDSFKGFTGSQLKVIEQIIGKADEVYMTFCADSLDESALDVFTNVRKTALSVIALAKKENVKIAPPVYLNENKRHNTALRSMEKYVFTHQGDVPEAAQPDGSITLTEAVGKYEEADFAARCICRLVRDEGYRYRHISVIARNSENYSGIIDSAMKRYGIPCFIDTRRRVNHSPLIVTVLKAVEAVSKNYDTQCIFTALKAGLSNIEQQDIYSLENYCFTWSVAGDDWKNEFTNNPDGMNRHGKDDSEKVLSTLNTIRLAVITPLEKLKDKLSAAEKAEDFCRALYTFCVENNINENLSRLADKTASEGDPELSDELRGSWSLLINILDRLTIQSGDTPLDFERFYSIFTMLISLADLGSIPKGIDEVCIGSAARTRPAEPRAVFILGASDGSFPAFPSHTGLISEADRKKLISLNLELTDTRIYSVIEENFLFYSAVCAPSDRLYISYAASGDDGSPASASAFVKSISALTGCPIKKLSEYGDLLPDAKLPAMKYMAENSGSVISASIMKYFEESNPPQLDTFVRTVQTPDAKISEETAAKLFDRRIPISPTAVETFHRCRFSYLCRYGFRAYARKAVAIDAANKGTLVHYVLENLFSAEKPENALSFSAEKLGSEVHNYLQQYVKENYGEELCESGEFQYQLGQIEFLLLEITERMIKELRNTSFAPAACELPFGTRDEKSLKPYTVTLDDGTHLKVNGVIDRLDTFTNDGKTYFRIVDYKTYNKSLSVDEIYYGLDLQMLIYMFAVEQNGLNLGGELVPSAVLYLPVRSIFSDDMGNDLENQKKLDDSIKMTGLILNSPEVLNAIDPNRSGFFLPIKYKNGNPTDSGLASAEFFGKTRKKIEEILINMGLELKGGSFCAEPLDFDDNSGCKYCDYAAVCPEGTGGIHKNVRKLTADEKKFLLNGGNYDEL